MKKIVSLIICTLLTIGAVMAQQMSLLLYRLPLDGLNATIGPDRVEKLMRINEQKMAEWMKHLWGEK